MAVSTAEFPLQTVAELTATVGVGLTVTTVVLELEHVPVVPTIEYVVFEVGLAVTILPVVALKPVAGVQLYVVAPFAVSDTELPEQTVAVFTVIVGVGITVTVVVIVPAQGVVPCEVSVHE